MKTDSNTADPSSATELLEPAEDQPVDELLPEEKPKTGRRNALGLDQLVKVTAIVRDVFTVAALAGAALWFLAQRAPFQKANVTHTVLSRQLSEEWVLVNVSARITNTGSRLLRLEHGQFKIQQVLPLEPLVAEALAENRFPDAHEGQILWPRIGPALESEALIEIEPGESETAVVDFIVPAGVETVRVYSQFSRNAGAELFWSAATLLDLKAQ